LAICAIAAIALVALIPAVDLSNRPGEIPSYTPTFGITQDSSQIDGHFYRATITLVSRTDEKYSDFLIMFVGPPGSSFSFILDNITWVNDHAILEETQNGCVLDFTRTTRSGCFAAGDLITIESQAGLALGSWFLIIKYLPTNNAAAMISFTVG
jgi:hypothetical protein